MISYEKKKTEIASLGLIETNSSFAKFKTDQFNLKKKLSILLLLLLLISVRLKVVIADVAAAVAALLSHRGICFPMIFLNCQFVILLLNEMFNFFFFCRNQ